MVAASSGHRSSGDVGKSAGRGGGNGNKDGGDNQNEDSSSMEEEEKSLIIPITSSNKNNNLFIEMFPDEVAEVPVSGMSAVLKEEKAGMSVWCDAALLYLKENGDENAAELLNSACDLEDSLAGSRSDRVRLLASAGIALLNRATSFKSGDRKALMEKDTAKASDRFNRAGIIDPMSPQAWVGNGMLNLTCDNTKQARFYFETTLKHCGPILPALLGLAAVRYQERDYRGAQELYGRAIRYYPQVNSSRIGFGMACYQLGQVDRARAAFARAHAVDTENVEAMLGCAILDMAAVGGADAQTPQHRQRLENAIKLISIANLVDGSNAMVQNHLANHYFWKWNPVMTGGASAAPVTVRIQKGSHLVELIQPESPASAITAQSLGLEVGERIRIGDLLETLIVGDDDEEETADDENRKTFKVRDKWPYDNDEETDNKTPAHKLWKKDYERVITLAKSAHDSTAVDEIQAESLLILARVYHSRDDMANASKYYDQACKKSPSLSPARFGLAQTAIWDEKFEDASAHLRLILGTLPHATDVLALLGLLGCKESSSSSNKQSNSSSKASSKGSAPTSNPRTEALAHLKKASDQEPLNAELVLLEALALQQKESDFPTALERYRRALQLMDGRQVSWEVYTNMGVLCHETKKYEDALGYYESALKALDEDLGDEAENERDGIPHDLIRHEANKLFWNYVDTNVTLGVPSTDSGGGKILPVEKGDTDALEKLQVGDAIRLGEDGSDDDKDMKADSEERRSKIAFESEITGLIKDGAGRVKAIKLKRKYRPPPTRSDTDMEVDTDKEKAPPTSLQMYVKRSNGRLLNPPAVSVAFNLARLHEAAGRIVAAVELHKAIVRRHPSYVNSYLRLACIARDCGSLKDCSEWLKSAAAVAPGNPEVLTLVGNLHLSLCDWAPAQSVFDQLYMQKVPNVEAYSLLCLGTIYFNNLKTPNKYAKHLAYAADFYKKILTSDKANAYAANGIGTILAERGELVKAKETFSRVREVSGDGIADSLLNLGHIFLAQKRHPEALQMYQSYMNRTRGTAGAPITSRSHEEDDAEVLLYIAFAYYDWARQTELLNDARSAPADERYLKCMECIEEAMKKSKRENVVLRYNLCIAKLRAANCVLLKPDRNVRRTAAEVQRALDGLEESLPVVRTLIQWKNEKKKVPIAMSMMNDYVTHCTRNIESAKKHLEDENEKEAKSREKREIQRLHALTEQKEREMEEALRRERDAIAREEREKRAKMKMAKVSSLVAGWEEEAAALKIAKEKSAEAGKKRKGPSVVPAVAPPGGVDVEEGIFDNEVPQLFDDTDDDDDDDDNENDKNKDAPPKKKLDDKPPPPPDNDPDEEEAAFGNDDDDAGAAGEGGAEGTENKAPAEEDLFGASSEEESDEELVGSSGKKRGTEGGDGGGATKKQRTLDDEEDEL